MARTRITLVCDTRIYVRSGQSCFRKHVQIAQLSFFFFKVYRCVLLSSIHLHAGYLSLQLLSSHFLLPLAQAVQSEVHVFVLIKHQANPSGILSLGVPERRSCMKFFLGYLD